MGFSGTDIAKVEALAEQYHKTIKAGDKRLAGSVKLNHSDGSEFYWRYAFAMKCDDWIIVFPEHHSLMVVHKSDCESLYCLPEANAINYLEEMPK